MSEYFLELSGVVKSFGAETVHKGLNLKVRAGKTSIVVGHSGAGKSVMLKYFIGLLEPDEGRVRVGGVDLYAGTGLITLEAARRTRSGGIYAITEKQQEFDTLKHLCSNLPKLSMPEIALSNSTITSDWKNSLVFDLIISKQLSSHAHIPIGKEGWRLSSKGRLLICEQDLMMEQRLWELISTGSESFSHDDLQAWKTIEEGFYREQAKASQQPPYEGLELVESSHKETTLNKRFREQDIKSWFSSPSPLSKWIDQQRDAMSKEVWEKKFNHHLSDTIQPWRRRYHFQLWKKSQ